MTVRARITCCLVSVITVFAAAAGICLWSIRGVVRAEDAITRALNMRVEVYAGLGRLAVAGVSAREYVLTGNPQSLNAFSRADSGLARNLSRLSSLSASEPSRHSRLEAIRPLVTRRLDLLREAVQARERGQSTAASALLGQDRAMTDSLRTELFAIDADLAADVSPLAADSDVQERRALAAVISGLLVSCVTVVILALLLRRDFDRRKKSEALYHGVVDVLAEGVFVRDRSGRIVECNPSAERILGLGRAEILGMAEGALACFREDGSPMPLEARPGVTARRESGAARSEIMGVRRPNGEMRWLLVNAAPMVIPGTAEFVGVTTSFADITRRKEAEANVSEQREQLQDFLENATDLIIIANPDGRLLYTNGACRAALGFSTETDLTGRLLTDFLDEESREQQRERVSRLIAGETLSDVQITLIGAGGRAVAVAGNISCRFEHGIPVAFRAILRDVTEINVAQEQLMLAIEQASAASRAKSEFLANMSHELRTPLNSVIGFAGVLMRNKSGHLAPTEIQYLQRIHDNGHHLLGLINSVLDLSKVEAGRMELDLEPVNLDALIRDTLAGMEGQLHGRSVVLRAIVPEGLAPFTTDAGKLKQVLINLVGNALKFTEQGSVTVRVLADARRVPIALEVVDTGIGIPKERQAAVFEAFRQADNSTARRFGGTGLGLTITRSLCQLLGFRISLASTPGVGTTFTVALGAGSATVEIPAETDAGAVTMPRVLIIDDDPDARLLLGQYVRDAGCHPTTIGTGEAGLRLAAAERPALILLDIMMPNMNGLEVLERLRADQALARIPVVIVSIVATENRRHAIGAAALIDKPVRRSDIEAVLRTYVDAPVPLDELIRQGLGVTA